MTDDPSTPVPAESRTWWAGPPTGAPSAEAIGGPPLVESLAPQIARRVVVTGVLAGVVGQWLVVGQVVGANLLVCTGLVLLAAGLVRPRDRGFDRLDVWLLPAALVFAAFAALRADPALAFFDLLATIALTAASVAAIGGVPVTRRSVGGLVRTAVHGTAFAIGGSSQLAPALEGARDSAGRHAVARVRPAAVGALLALPVLLVFVTLFALADEVFATLLARTFDLRIDLADWPGRIAVAALLAWAVAGVLVLLAGATDEVGRDRPIRVRRRLGATEATVVLAVTVAVFALFAVIQALYLFGGQDTLAASGMTYSEYARRGFFELVTAAALAGGLVLVLEVLVARRPRAYRLAALALVALIAPLLASAAVRLALYQGAYGWTELRFLVAAAICWLAACVVAALVCVATDRSAWLPHAVVILGLVVAVGVNVVGPSAFVATENVARALDPSRVPADGESGLDLWYLLGLGDDAVPVLAQAYPHLPAADRELVGRALLERRQELLRLEARTGWPSWNLRRQRALDALRGIPLP